MVGWRRSRSELPYLAGIALALIGSCAWLVCTYRRLRRATSSADSDIMVRLVLFLVAKAVLLALEITMLCGAWSDVSTGWYVALGILLLDLPTIAAAGTMWKQAKRMMVQFQEETQKKRKERRSEYLDMLPRLSFQEFSEREQENNDENEFTNDRVPDEKDIGSHQHNKCSQDQCIICLADFKPDCTVVRLDCGHVYHEGCISTWLMDEKRDPCPFRCTNFPADLVRADQADQDDGVEATTSATAATHLVIPPAKFGPDQNIRIWKEVYIPA
ncbi:RNF128 [Symbiodinium sp. CCMP2592]|nr:RNF128 [Symbiodinium sp. CCMP2592]